MPRISCTALPEEHLAPMNGDHICGEAQLVATRAITISAPPAQVFPWIRQMGYGKAGWYSYDIIDNLGRRSATSIHPEWQGINSGDSVPGGLIDFHANLVNAPHTFVMSLRGQGRIAKRISFSLAYELHEHPVGTRLVTRVRARIDLPLGTLLSRYVLGPGDGIMLRKQLRNIARRAESMSR
ncbi:unannotated protein [freshwater metagenome]|uniref:Unannotated protein n=1 Tax=freshwater metagenome TaxID=449393 RepID=A0A6J6KKT0_9ZZZZ